MVRVAVRFAGRSNIELNKGDGRRQACAAGECSGAAVACGADKCARRITEVGAVGPGPDPARPVWDVKVFGLGCAEFDACEHVGETGRTRIRPDHGPDRVIALASYGYSRRIRT